MTNDDIGQKIDKILNQFWLDRYYHETSTASFEAKQQLLLLLEEEKNKSWLAGENYGRIDELDNVYLSGAESESPTIMWSDGKQDIDLDNRLQALNQENKK